MDSTQDSLQLEGLVVGRQGRRLKQDTLARSSPDLLLLKLWQLEQLFLFPQAQQFRLLHLFALSRQLVLRLYSATCQLVLHPYSATCQLALQ
jgi:hypothetical protein